MILRRLKCFCQNFHSKVAFLYIFLFWKKKDNKGLLNLANKYIEKMKWLTFFRISFFFLVHFHYYSDSNLDTHMNGRIYVKLNSIIKFNSKGEIMCSKWSRYLHIVIASWARHQLWNLSLYEKELVENFSKSKYLLPIFAAKWRGDRKPGYQMFLLSPFVVV